MPYCIDESQQYLTPKEAKVLFELAAGNTRKQIARLLCREESTIKSHIKHISEKLGSKNAANMVMVALEKGVIKLLTFGMVCVLSFNCVMPGLDNRAPLRRPPRAVGVSRTVARVRVERLGGAAA